EEGRNHQVQVAVSVQIGKGHGGGRIPDVVVCLRAEAAVALAQQDRDGVVAVRGDDIEGAVAVQVAQGHEERVLTHGIIGPGAEGAVAVARTTEMVLSLLFAVTRSKWPSWFRSPNATETGPLPTARSGWGVKVPSPLFRKTVTLGLRPKAPSVATRSS